uniref:Small integral membrane protein 4 n=1 Tax=Stegastes partitus TaxID=144197 RepID=A0A3B4ZN59_9TELE
MFIKSKTVRSLLRFVPGKRRFGSYRFLPIFFCIGGVMEWIMINVRIGKETFCKFYRGTLLGRSACTNLEHTPPLTFHICVFLNHPTAFSFSF